MIGRKMSREPCPTPPGGDLINQKRNSRKNEKYKKKNATFMEVSVIYMYRTFKMF